MMGGCRFGAAIGLLALTAQVGHEDIARGRNESWLTYAGDYGSRRHSPLDQIRRDNVSSLVPAWVYHVEGAKKLETTPLVYKGIMYVTDTTRWKRWTRAPATGSGATTPRE